MSDAAAAAGGSALSSAASIYESKRNRDFQKASYKHRYRWQMKDMKAAGLNPILAGNLGAGGALSGSQASISDLGQAAASGSSAKASNRMATKQELLLESEIGKNESTTAKEVAAESLYAAQASQQQMMNARTAKANEAYLDGTPSGDAIFWMDNSNTVQGGVAGAAKAAQKALQAERAAKNALKLKSVTKPKTPPSHKRRAKRRKQRGN